MSALVTIESMLSQGWSETDLRNALAQLGYSDAKSCNAFPAQFKGALDKIKASQSQPTTKTIEGESSLAAQTQDALLDVAVDTNIELDQVLVAYQQLGSLKKVLKWATLLQQKRREQEEAEEEVAIEASVDRYLEMEKLTKETAEVKQKLAEVFTPVAAPRTSVKDVERMVGVAIPSTVQDLAKTDLSAKGETPDFLKLFQEQFKAQAKLS